MPRGLLDYGAEDWRHLRPALEAFHTWRVQRATRQFVTQPPREGDLDEIARLIRGRRVLVTIGFNDPEILACQIRTVRAFISDAVHVIADNSSDSEGASEIAAVCARLGALHLRLPANPWGARSPSRSHGAALNWVWRRLLHGARPEAFGFLDHDLIPLAPDDPFAGLANRPIAGDKRWAEGRWYLWAGFCFFRRDFLDGVKVDFGQDWPLSLDTGGANWTHIYSRFDPSELPDREIAEEPALADHPLADAYFERRGVWVHEVGTFGRPELKPAKRRRLLAMADTALRQASGTTPAAAE